MTLSAQPANDQATAPLMAVPISFKCPLTGQVMRDPVATCDGQVFERVAIESWFRHGHRTSPMTGMELEAFTVTSQPALRAAIDAFMLHPSTTGKVSSDYACERNISHGQQEPTTRCAAAVEAAAEAGADVPVPDLIGEDSAFDHVPTKSLISPMLATVLESDVESTSGPPSDDHDEAEVKRLLHGLHFKTMRPEKKTAANASASPVMAEPLEIAKQIISVAQPHSTPVLRASQRSIRGSSAAEKAVARSSLGIAGSQRARVQPPNTCADSNSCCPGSTTKVCREPSPLRTPKAGGRCSPPRRRAADTTSNAAIAATTGGRASPERQRRKQLARPGSPLHGRATPAAADSAREGRPRRAPSRNPSPEALFLFTL